MADSSSDRVAELKRKMQETAAKRMAEQAEKENASLEAAGIAEPAPAAAAPAVEAAAPAAEAPAAEAPAAVVESAASSVQPVAEAAATATVEATATATLEAAPAAAAAPAPAAPVAPIAEATPAVAAPAQNGASAAPGDPELPHELTAEEIEKREMTRRELLTYAWGGALALVGGAVGVGLFGFMYPRFRAGEFGGEFFIASAEMPPSDGAPVAFSAGKFWLVQTEEAEPRALYMVCTHLGCLYKWEESNFRFECPCHGSKFSKDGYYIEGPAPRSLDLFATTMEGDTITVDTGSKTIGAPAGESPARAHA